MAGLRVWKHIIKKQVELEEMENWQIVFYMQIYQECHPFFQTKEVKNKLNKHIRCYLIASGAGVDLIHFYSLYLSTFYIQDYIMAVQRLVVIKVRKSRRKIKPFS